MSDYRTGYNAGLLTAILLARENGGEMAETLVAGLEASRLSGAIDPELGRVIDGLRVPRPSSDAERGYNLALDDVLKKASE